MKILSRIGALCVLVLLVALVGTARAQNTTTRVSVSSTGAQGSDFSNEPAITADGRYVAFVSRASNLVGGDTNGTADVFIRDRVSGVTTRVSLGSSVVEADMASWGPAVSGDSRFVAFTSAATNLVSGDTNAAFDVFVRDRSIPTTFRVSVASKGLQANGFSESPSISADGRYVAFESRATNLVPSDTNDTSDIFLHDRMTSTTVRLSVSTGGTQATGHSYKAAMSADARIVAFESRANLVPGDSNAESDIFVRDVQAGTTTRVSVGSGGEQANGPSHNAKVSGDGRFVVFRSFATNLQASGSFGIYVHDRQTGVTSALYRMADVATISGDGGQICVRDLTDVDAKIAQLVLVDRQTLAKTRLGVVKNGPPFSIAGSLLVDCAINGDGSVVAFSTDSSNLVPSDTNDKADVFARTALAEMALDKTALKFGAATSGGAFVLQTAAQTVRLSQSGVGAISWTATSDQPWLQVTPASGAGSGTLSIGVTPAAGLPPSGIVSGNIVVTLTGAVNALPPIPVTLTLMSDGTTTVPVGVVDTPTDFRTGVTGAVPFTGWALDDVEVTRVSICRDAFGAEVAPIDPNCGGAAEIFVGFAVFIDGARPDVLSAFAGLPLAARAGWGFMVLTNMLPGQGNGTYRFTMRAQDREGTWAVLGRRTMTCANASATLPFGTLDTPFQGGVASGTSYVNFGWALTPLPKTIPIDGSTIHVLVDGVDVGVADYNHVRSDIQALFPNFNNTTGANGAVGFRILDTTLLDNGLHTISWAVTDDAGAVEGIGSRFFTVANGASAVTASAATAASTSAASASSQEAIDALAVDTMPLSGRRGWDLEAPHGSFAASATGVTVVRSEEVNRVELQLGAGDYVGYLRTPSGLAPLPIGSRLDTATNTFTWAPGVGFVGRYDLVFVRSVDGRAMSRRDVRVVLHPKGRGSVGPQVVIDIPAPNATVTTPFMIGGWAADLDAADGTGVTTLHAWAYPASGGAPIFLGATVYGGARPDVGAVHGDRFKESGFGLIVQGLPAGDYDLALFAWSTEKMNFVAPTVVRVNVRP